jgi:hypothetical protein
MIPYNNREFHHPELNQDYYHRRFAAVDIADTSYALVLSTIAGKDQMTFAEFTPDGETKREIISDAPGLHWSPNLSASPTGRIYACWVSKSQGYYKLIIKYRDNGIWQALPELQEENAFYDPVAGEDGAGNIILLTGIAMHSDIDLYSMKLENDQWSMPELLSGIQNYARRPVLVPGDGPTAIVFWDGFDDQFDLETNGSWNCLPETTYDADTDHECDDEECSCDELSELNPVLAVYMTVMRDGSPTRSFLMSGSAHWQLKPTACRMPDGRFCCAWLRNTDVERDGVIAQKCDIMTIFATLDGPEGPLLEATDLRLGLLPNKTYFGYDGLRRFPQLATDNDNVYLCYEVQKGEEPDWDNLQNGYFVSRKLAGDSWSEPVMLAGENFSHHLAAVTDGTAKVICKSIRDESGFDLARMDLSIDNAPMLMLPALDGWSQWQEITLPDARTALSGSIPELPDKSVELLWGDLHCHSVDSADAEGEPDELLLYARYKAELQFSGITDNDVYLHNLFHNSLSAFHDALVEDMSEDGEFIAFNGYEYTFHRWCEELVDDDIDREMYNHRSIIFTAADQFIAHRCFDAGKDEVSFYKTMKNTQALFNAHHQHFELFDSEHERNVEVASAWNLNIETDPYVHRELDAGKQFGFNGSSDNHRFIPGLNGPITGLLTNSMFTRENIVDALYHRHCFASAGVRNLLAMTVNDHCMGEAFVIREPEVTVNCAFEANRPEDKFTSAQLILNGKVVLELDPERDNCCEFSVMLKPGANYIYLRAVCGNEIKPHPHNIAEAYGGNFWTSPVFIENFLNNN